MSSDLGQAPPSTAAQPGSVHSTGRTHDEWLELAESGRMDAEQRETLIHVLAHWGVPGAYRGGQFTRALLEAIAFADPIHRAQLGRSFPELVGFFAVCSHVGDGMDRLRAAAGLPAERAR
jgi:hypothetical protein